MADAVTDLVRKLNKLTPPQGSGATVIQGVITDWNSGGSPPTVSMKISGSDTAADGFRYLPSYAPVVGDVVQCVMDQGSILVLGPVATASTILPDTVLQDWTVPTPFGGGVTSGGGGAGPCRYRVLRQGGVIKTQIRGSVTISGGASGSPFGLFTLNNLAAPDSESRMIVCVTTVGLGYIQYNWNDNVANLMGATGATAVIFDGHEFFPGD